VIRVVLDQDYILKYLELNKAVITGKHFIYTSGKHGTSYINMREVASHTDFIYDLGVTMAKRVEEVFGDGVDLIIGPETLGRDLAFATSVAVDSVRHIWCDMGELEASFSLKLGFDKLAAGKNVFIVDDLLTTGSSIVKVRRLVESCGGNVLGAGVVVRRTPDVTAETCGVPTLIVLADVEGFALYEPDACPLCEEQIPVVLRPGHGHEWIKTHEAYPTE
jgi:orotate phosphoribosyltransferase